MFKQFKITNFRHRLVKQCGISCQKNSKQKKYLQHSFIDHWVNYKERFTRESETVLPDRLWLADREAEEIASREFPELPITVLGNKWLCDLKEIVQEKKKRQNSIRRQAGAQVLYYFSEPIRDESTGIPNGHEFNALDNWIKQLPRLIEKGLVTNNPNQLQIDIRASLRRKNKYKSGVTKTEISGYRGSAISIEESHHGRYDIRI